MPKSALTGSRIREHRLMRGLKQTELARMSGISASYLNLIEHNRRRIGGKTLLALSEILDIDPSQLSQGAEHAVVSELQNAAASPSADGSPSAAVELDQIDDLVARFPGWAAKITEQHRRLQALQQTVGGLNDRLTHDPILSEKMHEVLSTVAAIRSTASILVGNPDLDADWQSRFYSNIDTESRRLADSSATMAAHLDRLSRPDDGVGSPLETLFAALDVRGHHISELEVAADFDAVLSGLTDFGGQNADGPTRRYLHRYHSDAMAMPLAPFTEAAAKVGFDPGQLATEFGVELNAVFRRLASLPRSPAIPDMGLVACDAAGGIIMRKSPSGLSMPRFGAGCPLWPLFSAFIMAGTPIREQVESDNGATFTAFAVTHTSSVPDYNQPPRLEATMLLISNPEGTAGKAAGARPIGATCRVCARAECGARREPSVLGSQAAPL